MVRLERQVPLPDRVVPSKNAPRPSHASTRQASWRFPISSPDSCADQSRPGVAIHHFSTQDSSAFPCRCTAGALSILPFSGIRAGVGSPGTAASSSVGGNGLTCGLYHPSPLSTVSTCLPASALLRRLGCGGGRWAGCDNEPRLGYPPCFPLRLDQDAQPNPVAWPRDIVPGMGECPEGLTKAWSRGAE